MSAAEKLPGTLEGNRRLDQWLQFNPDRSITLAIGRVELGQGVLTALAQIAAEELDVAFPRIRVLSGDTAIVPNEGVTSGSRSINEGGMAVRYACAEVRHLLLKEAALRLGIAVEKLSVADGTIAGPGGEITYWQLPHATLLARQASASVSPKQASRHSIVGTNVGRLDIPDKVTGTPRFVQDIELPGMLFGRVVRPPSFAAKLTSFDRALVENLPGVVALVVDGNFIGVVALREEQAVKARLAALSAAQWQEGVLPADETDIYDFLVSRPSKDQVVIEKSDAAALARGERSFSARYTKPYLAHASMAPSCALAKCDEGIVEVWTHSQSVFALQQEIALILDLPAAEVRVHHAEGPGCYGHNGADDAAFDAVLLSRAVSGRPVQVQWMRDDEFAWEPLGPAMVIKTRASLDAEGNIVDWAFDVWSNGHMHRPGSVKTAGRVSSLIGAWHVLDSVPRAPQVDAPMFAGIANNAVAGYDLPNQRVVEHCVLELPLRVSSLRALGAYANVFALESFIDELAAASGSDPVEFRLRHMKNPRARAVMELAAARAGWQPGVVSDGTTGYGFAFAQYKNYAGYFAIAVELELDQGIRVRRAVAAVDVGQAINPDGVINQNEGGIIQAISWTLKEQVRFDRERITSRSWEDYPILTFPEVPKVEVHLINRPDEAPLGAGELAMGPTAAAIANALHQALGVRIRDLPLTVERITRSM